MLAERAFSLTLINNAIVIVKFVLEGKTIEEIAETSGLSPKYIKKVKTDLLEETNLEQFMKQFASYKQKLLEERSINDMVSLNSSFKQTSLHKECTHFLLKKMMKNAPRIDRLCLTIGVQFN